jgi:hypothetical protein
MIYISAENVRILMKDGERIEYKNVQLNIMDGFISVYNITADSIIRNFETHLISMIGLDKSIIDYRHVN